MGRKTYPTVNFMNLTPVEVKASIIASTSSTILDLGTATAFKLMLAANTSVSFINAPPGPSVFTFKVYVQNDATANRTLAWIGSGVSTSVKWEGGTPALKTIAANAIDYFEFFTEDGGATYVGRIVIKNYS